MRIYRYILTADTGMAPCIDAGIVSLATCKPVVRRCATPGDWVIGFLASPAPSGMVAWAGRISRSLAMADYEREFRGRSDAVYRGRPDGSFRRLRRDYHALAGQMETDLSGPALVFDPAWTWYFGDRPQMLPVALAHLAAHGQGHRVNGVAPDDPARLLAWLSSLGPPGLHGEPPDRQAERACGPRPAPRDCATC
jgi:Nucleotide modification associated domain 2